MFSHRYHYSEKRQSLQRESIDVPLRTSLWNLFVGIYFKKSSRLSYYPWMMQFAHLLYTEFLSRPVIEVPVYSSKVREEMREFFLNSEWFKIYDFLEFVAAIDSNSRGRRYAWHNPIRKTFVHYTNVMLERHSAAYRFVGYKIQEITDPEELKLLHDSLEVDDELVRVRLQMRSAFESLISERVRNYKTAIVEMLKGLDLLSEIVMEKKGVNLGALIDTLPLDSRLILSLKTFFSHRQEGEVIYHPLLEKRDLTFSDTKFFLVMALGLCNYVSSFDKKELEESALNLQADMHERTKIENNEIQETSKNSPRTRETINSRNTQKSVTTDHSEALTSHSIEAPSPTAETNEKIENHRQRWSARNEQRNKEEQKISEQKISNNDNTDSQEIEPESVEQISETPKKTPKPELEDTTDNLDKEDMFVESVLSEPDNHKPRRWFNSIFGEKKKEDLHSNDVTSDVTSSSENSDSKNDKDSETKEKEVVMEKDK